MQIDSDSNLSQFHKVVELISLLIVDITNSPEVSFLLLKTPWMTSPTRGLNSMGNRSICQNRSRRFICKEIRNLVRMLFYTGFRPLIIIHKGENIFSKLRILRTLWWWLYYNLYYLIHWNLFNNFCIQTYDTEFQYI